MSLKLAFTPKAWEHYTFWQQTDKTILKRLNVLLQELTRHPKEGKGEPEMLKGNLQGYWSRRITLEHRLVYRILQDTVEIYACRSHYEEEL